MRTRAEIAGFYRLGLNLRLIEPSRVIAWADNQILQTESPDDAIIDLALADPLVTARMDDALRGVEGWPYHSPGAVHLLGALLWLRVNTGEMTTEAVSKLLYTSHAFGGAEVFGDAIYWIDECFGPYMDPVEGDRTVRDLLQQFSGEELPPV
jgi:hypothetical protein